VASARCDVGQGGENERSQGELVREEQRAATRFS
jgi:hypothetical protein